MSKKFSNTPRGTGRVLTLVSLISAAFSASAQTAIQQEQQTLAPVVVSASRFPNDPTFSPIGATVITADQIREAGVTNVNEAVRKIGGVHGRQSAFGTSDAPLDLRGFGAFGDQNIVILVDGIRISENEQTQALMSSIPIEAVERIEIVRGGSSVLYGEGATGGTIQIITKRAKAGTSRGTIVGSVGNFGHVGLNTYASKAWQNFAIDASVAATDDDNYRRNNEVQQRNFSGGFQWFEGQDRVGVRIDIAERKNRFPGSLSFAQFQNDPRQTTTPDEYGNSELNKITLFGNRQLGNIELAAELAHRDRDYDFFQFGGLSRYNSRTIQFSPRIRHLTQNSELMNELVVGIDLMDTERNRNASFARDNATQDSQAIYFRNQLKSGQSRIAAGARHEKFEKSAVDPLNSASDYRKNHSLNAWEIEGAHSITKNASVFAKFGTSYRVANVDDNAFQTRPLNPQTSRDAELGATVDAVNSQVTVKLFQHRLKNEILADANGTNVNLDPTRRRGVELEANSRIAAEWTSMIILQHVTAKFTEGPNVGKEVVLVPRNTVSLRLNWLPATHQSADIGIRWVDSQRHGGDFNNTCSARIPSYTTLDARYAKRMGQWEFAVSGTNLTDRDYYSNAFGTTCPGGIYPDAGRQLKFSVRRDF